jgi:hypothetical protein
MTSTLIGLFDTPAEAEQARSKIMASNVPSIDVQVYDKAGFQLTGGTDTSTRGFFESFAQTLGFGPSNQAMYQEGVQRGGTIVSVRTDDGRINEIADILNRCGAVDIDTRAAESWAGSWKIKGTKPEVPPSDTADTAIKPAMENDLTVDKLETKCGNVWVYRHIKRRAA